jgi:hypothetical protein
MEVLKKRKSLYFLIVVLLLFITAGILKNNSKEKVILPAAVEKIKPEAKKIEKKVAARTPKKTSFKSNDEIKTEYGKLEKVYLWNGKSYTGAVINTEDTYSIVTVEGVINIPMKDVKIREIIR